MKKTLVSALAAALVVGAAGTTFAAANPFSDVPRDHWAYDAVTQLANDGVVEGYGDGTFRGDRNITRYEMAQMVAKAMAKGDLSASDRALVDRLAAEFADELNNLGVRVSNLERNADMVKWNGKVEYTYTSERFETSRTSSGATKVNDNNLLFRLEPSAEVNDHWSAHARLDAEMKVNKDAGEDGSDKVELKYAWAQGDYGNFQVKLGRMELLSAEAYAKPGALVFDHHFSGAEVSFGKDLRVKLQAGRLSKKDELTDPPNYQGAELMYNGRLTGGIGYYHLNSDNYRIFTGGKDNMSIWSVNAGYSFDKNNFLSAAYARNNSLAMDGKYKKSYQISYDYKGAKPEDQGSWGAYAAYRYIAGAALGATTDGAMELTKGVELGADYTLLPNVVLSAKYFRGKDLSPRVTDGKDNVSKLFGRVEFFF